MVHPLEGTEMGPGSVMNSWIPSFEQRQRIAGSLLYATLYALGLARSFSKPLNHDAAWYLYGAGRVVQGAKLYRDIVDINPPLIFYFGCPAVLLARSTPASGIGVFDRPPGKFF